MYDVIIYYPWIPLPVRASTRAHVGPFARLACPATSAPALTASHGEQSFVFTVHGSVHAYFLHLFTILIHSFCYLCY